MGRPEDGQRRFFPSGNPFRNIFSKGSYLSPKLIALLNSFEQSLSARLKQLKPADKTDILSLSWMKLAMESLCETHVDIKALITDLKFPVSDWDEKWVAIYLNNSIKLLDICIAFNLELSRLNQGQLLLQYVLHVLESLKDSAPAEQLLRAHASLQDWKEKICSKNPKLDSCAGILHELTRSLHMAKVKSSAKGIVLMRAMFGVRVMTIFVCSVFVAALSGQENVLIDLHISEKFPWSEPFNDLQASVSGEVKGMLLNGKVTVLKELETLKGDVEKIYLATDGDRVAEAGSLQNPVVAFAGSAEKFAKGVDILSKQVDGFFQTVLTGRDALLCNLRVADVEQENNADL